MDACAAWSGYGPMHKMRSFIGSLMVLGLVGIAPSTASADVGTESRAR
jgi:hypothetical protein